jgi:hypothetical protein
MLGCLALLLASLVKCLAHARGTQPAGTEVLDVEEAAVLVLFVGAKSGELGSFDGCEALSALGRLILVRWPIARRLGRFEIAILMGVSGGGVPD